MYKLLKYNSDAPSIYTGITDRKKSSACLYDLLIINIADVNVI